MTRHSYSIDEIKDRLLARVGELAYHYAPAVQGSYEDKGRYFTLNPGRVDRRVGSFYVYVSGPKAGKWRDHATGQYGDILDLIALSLGTDLAGALREARAVLGLSHEDHATRRQREKAAAEAKARRRQAEADAKAEAERRRGSALRLFLSARERIAGTPVARYLADARGVDLSRLGRQPRAIRYLPECFYRHMDPETGEVMEARYPAMLASMTGPRGFAAVHRTYLALGPDGRWGKAPVPKAKKVLGDPAGAWIPLWRGVGPRGGLACPLSDCPPGTALFLAEGIEDALSAALLLPEARHLAAYSLGNMAALAGTLPANVATVTLIADQDEGAEARAALDRAVAAHQRAGRSVRIWRNGHGGKDLNDALRAAAQGGKGAA